MVATNNQRLSAKKEAAWAPVKSDSPTSARAEKVKTPNPRSANGTVASHTKDWLLLKPLILLSRSIGPFKRLASWRREVLRLGGDCKAVVINNAYCEKTNGLLIQDLYIYKYARNTGTQDVRIYTKKTLNPWKSIFKYFFCLTVKFAAL